MNQHQRTMIRTPFVFAIAACAAAACGDKRADDVPAARAAADAAPARVGADGYGKLRIGMSASAARAALGAAWSDNGAGRGEGCRHVRIAEPSSTVRAMVVGETVARVEVDSGTIVTDRGARVGDSEERIDSLYRGLVRVEPHKYTDGHYLVVTPAADSTRRIIFETDGNVVTRYRAGRMPEVEWVEGCS